MSRRNKAVVIRFTEDEWRLLNDKVKKAKLPREKFCRAILLGAKVNAPPDADYVSLIFEVRRVGSNLNQYNYISVNANIIIKSINRKVIYYGKH